MTGFRSSLRVTGVALAVALVACGAIVDLGGPFDASVPPVQDAGVDAAIDSAFATDAEDGSQDDAAIDAPADGLGDSSMDAALDAHSPGVTCAPCAAASDCELGLMCAVLTGDLYCLAPCGAGSTCGSGETCSATKLADAGDFDACVPTGDSCTTTTAPLGPDGGPLDECGAVVGPSISANCEACSKSASDCQPNGCYGGYWCNTSIHDCGPPPKTCATP